ncbi:Snf7-domain-containing protein [Aspergillus sclerotiicarbonarius CBS 121057]|uniref:Snf7-domain-containing protein n=1 Tax=Aspergillus sclerotiicarbonarius (strain CBS 121057 / IBT 28362) TaxID=1448318 RepID=A0A319DWV7_ASPSB|nr:Snf7-domain-containing protein [Aspergillus sclerotiicarbonarius CBS 121057]
MGNTNSSHKISAQDRAILDLKNQRDKLHQYQKRITVLTDRETAIAKECLARNDRKRALLALRRKKYQESLLDKTDKQLEQLEQLTGQIEFALVQKDVLFGLQQGTKVLQTINKEMGGLEGVEKLMGETEEARAYQESRYADEVVAVQEISEMLAGRLSTQDEDEVEEELEALQRDTQGPVVLPNAPSSTFPEPTEAEGIKEDEHLAEEADAGVEERVAIPA